MLREGPPESERDFFISYAREDEETLAKPLAAAFQARGVKFWLDRVDLRPGGILEDDIHNGLLNSRHAVMIISRSFLEKDWPKRELDILLTLEAVDERRKIVTVRHELTQSELEQLAPLIAQRTAISFDGDAARVCDRVIELSLEYEQMPQKAGVTQDGAAIFPTFYAKDIFTCNNTDCPWIPDPRLDRLGLSGQGRQFTMARREQHWYVTCTSCGNTAFGPLGVEKARWLLSFLRLVIYAPERSTVLNTSFLPKEYLALKEKERSLTRGALSAVARNDSGEKWLAARDAYAGEIELAMQAGNINRNQYDELGQINRRHGEEFSNVLESKSALARGGTLTYPSHSAPRAQTARPGEDEEALFPAAERDRIRRDLSTLMQLPPTVRADLSADLRERIEKFTLALVPLRECQDHALAQLYTGCLFYWSCLRTVVAGTDAERAAMDLIPIKCSRGVITGYFPAAEYFLARYRAASTGGPAEEQLLHEVESWMNAVRSQRKANEEMRNWTSSS